MTDELIAALDDCLNAIASGATVEAALDRYPALAVELRPMLEAAREAGASSSLAAIPRQEQLSSRAKFLARAAELRVLSEAEGSARSASRRGFVSRLFAARALATGFAVVLALVIGTYGLVSASAQSLPGDPLYGVKRTVEQTQLLLASDPQMRTQLEEQFAERRVQETRTLITKKREVQVEFRGRIASITGERWSVAGITVIVASETQVSGDPAPGVVVEVSGLSQADGTVLAARVSVIAPAATSTPTAPIASPTAIALPSATPTPAPTEEPPASPSPSPIPSATEGVTLAPGASPSPTEDQGAEVEFTGTPGPTASRTPQPTPTSTLGSGDGSGPSPSNTPKPSQTPEPHLSETPEATHTPGSGGESTPTATTPPALTPTNTPESEEVEFEGTLQSISGNVWTVGGQAMTVTGSTEITDNPQVGDSVRVHARRQVDGSLVAERIEKR